MLGQRPRHHKAIATGWHAGMACGALLLTVSAFLGWYYHEVSDQWVRVR